MKNEKGFGAVEVLVLLVVVGLIGGTGWYFWQNKQSKPQPVTTNQANSQTQRSETKPKSDCDPSYKSENNEKIGISFCYPKTWKAEIMDTSSNHIAGTITLTSPDYKEVEGGFGGSNTGSKVYVSVYKIDQLGAAYTSVKSILDGTEQGKSVYSEVKAAKIAGIDGASFISAYEGPRILTNEFEYKSNQYSIALEEDLNGPTFNENKDTYQKIVDSFKLL